MVHSLDDRRLSQIEQIEIAPDVPLPVGEALPSKRRLVESQFLNLRAHGTVQNEDALAEELV